MLTNEAYQARKWRRFPTLRTTLQDAPPAEPVLPSVEQSSWAAAGDLLDIAETTLRMEPGALAGRVFDRDAWHSEVDLLSEAVASHGHRLLEIAERLRAHRERGRQADAEGPAGAPVRLTARIADITTLAVDAIVNAANSALSHGGGVCGAIHHAAGPELWEACAGLAPCPTGEARITPAFRLPCKAVIHAVGPMWEGGAQDEARLLASAYGASLELARRHGVRTIAFPAISTGIYGYPLGEATAIAVATVREATEGVPGVREVIFACFSDEVLEAYHAAGVPASA